MAYKQYTQCVDASKHLVMDQYVRMLLIGGSIGALMVGVAIAAGHPWCGLISLQITAAATQLAYASWWLNDRLICLGGDKYGVGLLLSVSRPESKEWPDSYDTDLSINLFLYPNHLGAPKEELEKSTPFGYLIAEQPATRDIKVPFTGEITTDAITGVECSILHAEFEGGGVKLLFDTAGAAMLMGVAALVVCMAVPPPWGTIVALALVLLALLLQFLGSVYALKDRGSESDVNPALGAFHPRDEWGGPLFDIIGVYGTWVYDAGHNNQGKGWNEIHPIKACNKVGDWDGISEWPPIAEEYAGRFEAALQEANSPATKSRQEQPENLWIIHPALDGCSPAAKVATPVILK